VAADGGVGVKMRANKGIFNKAIGAWCHSTGKPIIRLRPYKISRLRGKGFKRALDFVEIMPYHQFRFCLTTHIFSQLQKITLFFSFYTRGMKLWRI